MKSASGLWFLHLVFKVLFLFKIKFGKRYMLIYDYVLKFKLGFEHFQLRFYGERMKLKRTKIPFVYKSNCLSFNTGVCADKLDPAPFKVLGPGKTYRHTHKKTQSILIEKINMGMFFRETKAWYTAPQSKFKNRELETARVQEHLGQCGWRWASRQATLTGPHFQQESQGSPPHGLY